VGIRLDGTYLEGVEVGSDRSREENGVLQKEGTREKGELEREELTKGIY